MRFLKNGKNRKKAVALLVKANRQPLFWRHVFVKSCQWQVLQILTYDCIKVGEKIHKYVYKKSMM